MAIDYRVDYTAPGLDEWSLPGDPMEQFRVWFDEAVNHPVPEANAMALATVSAAGEPSVRMVLLKDAGPCGFTFYTNYESAKARDMQANARVSLCFFWQPLHRQVRVSGGVAPVSRAESAGYFATRPRTAQMGAWASRQSSVITSRTVLEDEFARLEREFQGRDVPLPDHWGGYRVTPDQLEFWQGQPNRLHDRVVYRRVDGDRWRRERLSP